MVDIGNPYKNLNPSQIYLEATQYNRAENEVYEEYTAHLIKYITHNTIYHPPLYIILYVSVSIK